MSELILLTMYDMGKLKSDSGRVPTLLRELCDIPYVPSAAALMTEVLIWLEDLKFVRRTKKGKGTRQIELITTLSDDHVKSLREHEAANREQIISFIDWEREHLPETVRDYVKDCERALHRIRQVAADPETHREGDWYAINMSETIKSLGFRPQRTTDVRALLREVGLIESKERPGGYWVWRVNMIDEIDQQQIADLATVNIEGAIQRAIIAKVSKPASSSDDNAAPNDKPESVETAPAAEMPEGMAKSKLGQLLEILERLNVANDELNHRNSELIRENQRLTSENRELADTNQQLVEANATLRREVDELRRQLDQYDTELELADEFLKKFKG